MRVLRLIFLSLILVPFAAATSLLVVLAVWAFWPGADSLAGSFRLLAVLSISSLVLTAGLTVWSGVCLVRGRWQRVLGVSALATTTVIVWLAWDPSERPTPSTSPGPVREPAAGGDDVVRWHWARDGAPPTRRSTPPHLPAAVAPQPDGEWRLFVVSHAGEIRSEWERCQDSRDWIRALDAFPVIGETVQTHQWLRSSSPWTATVQLHCAYASLLAVEAHGDEALAALRPALSVARKLQIGAQTSWRFLPARQAQRACQSTVEFILRTTPVSAAALAPLEPLLSPGADLGAAWRRILASDFAWLSRTFVLVPDEIKDPSTRIWSNVGALPFRCVINPRATRRLAAEEFEKLIAVATEGRGEGLRAQEAAIRHALLRRTYKNALGRFFLAEFMSNYAVVVEQEGWRIEDQRRALLAALQAKLAVADSAPSRTVRPPAKGTP